MVKKETLEAGSKGSYREGGERWCVGIACDELVRCKMWEKQEGVWGRWKSMGRTRREREEEEDGGEIEHQETLQPPQ